MLQTYIAAPLFTEAERTFNENLCHALREYCECYLPQREGILLAQAVREGGDRNEISRSVFAADIAAIRHAEVVIAVLDGSDVDSGVAVEVGVAWALGKTVLGVRTDSRMPISGGLNPMIEGACRCIATDLDELMQLVVGAAHWNE